jgi:pyridoxine 4-dehydrogenase
MRTPHPGHLEAANTFQLGGDLPVHRMGYGTMRLVGEGAWGEPKSREEAHAVLRRAVELGVTLFDTADAYGPHIAEELIAEALYPYADSLVIATKGGLTRTGPAKAKPLGRPDYLVQSVELSLRRLKLERIDLYQLHRIDPAVPVADTLGALKDLQTAGKIRHIGLSEVTPEEIEEAQKTVPIVSVQNKYNLTERKSEATLDYCTKHNIAFLPWYPMAAGRLSRTTANDGTNHPLDDLATKHGISVAQLSLAWLLHRSPVILPIPGTSSIQHLEENVAAASLTISEEDWDAIELIADTQAS